MNVLKASGTLTNVAGAGIYVTATISEENGSIIVMSSNSVLTTMLEDSIEFNPITFGGYKPKRNTMMAALSAVYYYIKDPRIETVGDWLEPLDWKPGRVY